MKPKNVFVQGSKLNAVEDISNTSAINSGDVSIVNTGYEVTNTGQKHQMCKEQMLVIRKLGKVFVKQEKNRKSSTPLKISLKNVNRK